MERNNRSNPELSRLLKQLRPFQLEAYEYATKGIVNSRQFHTENNVNESSDTNDTVSKPSKPNGRLLLADEMGLGKTIEALAIMSHYISEWPLLILCPASLKYIWPNEIEKFIPSLKPKNIYVIQGFDDADAFDNVHKRKQIRVVVASYSLLQKRSASARCLQQFKFQCVIADESHNLKQKDTQRTQLALPLLQNAKRLVLLSGTPALARPAELWTQVYVLAPELFGSYTSFTKKYCNAHRGRFGWDVSGASNVEELHLKLKQIMVRRLKSDVLKELPAKQRSIVPINISNKTKRKECEELMKELNDTRQSVEELVGDEATGAHFEARKLLMQAYQISGVTKSVAVAEYLVEWLRGSGAQKVLIFAHHKGVLDCLEAAVAKELKGGGHIRIDGSVSSKDRALRVRKFQNCSTIRVAILSMTAAGVGLTLTAASSVMFAELHWTPGVLAQAEDRCHRIGQRNAVNIMYLICEDSNLSVDPQLWKMLSRKINSLGRVVDGEKNASMNAQKSTEKKTGRGMSVQDELQSFFAETSVSDEQVSKVPAKGSILSYFGKQMNQKNQSNKAFGKNVEEDAKESSKPRSSFATKCAIEPEKSRNIEWDCTACTFHNSQDQHDSDCLACEICKTPYNNIVDVDADDSEIHLHQVTPSASARRKEKSSRLEGASARTQNIRRDEIETIVIDETEEETKNDRVARTAYSSMKNSPVLYDIPRKNSYPRKKQKITDHQPQSKVPANHKNPLSGRDQLKMKASPLLSFSVSENSGRITIHFYASGESTLTNFELDQIVSKETADRLMEARLSRIKNSYVAPVYDQASLYKVVESIDRQKLPKNAKKTILIREIQSFVDQYMLLREIEKKALKEGGNAHSGINLRQDAIRLMPVSLPKSTERYAGGAKERARERVVMGNGDQNDISVITGQSCAYCGGSLSTVSRLPGVISTYCSRECTDQGRVKRGMANQLREQVFALESGICRLCGIDGYALFTRIRALEPSERLNALCNANWKLPKSAKALDRLLHEPKEGDFWQADHILPVAQGGGGCGLENLRTLCVPCHIGETAKLRIHLKLHKTSDPEEPFKQADIRTMLKFCHNE
mmetsp:Transcript_57836/g.62483  ORF Transcript_57836/g.62483 Transcript_57836/m.62483 type:complete len:1089 (-) Transcript_57836:1165-4431(-)